MKQKRVYISPYVTIGQFLVKEYMMMPTISNALDVHAPKRRQTPVF